LLHCGVMGSARARAISIVEFPVGKSDLAIETALRINRL
jgi:hypothetical protein